MTKILNIISFISLLLYQVISPAYASVEPNPQKCEKDVTIINNCRQDIRGQGTNKFHIYTLSSLNACPRADQKTDDWITIGSGKTGCWHTENNCTYIVEPEATIKSPARFNNNDAVITCKNQFGFGVCRCENK